MACSSRYFDSRQGAGETSQRLADGDAGPATAKIKADDDLCVVRHSRSRATAWKVKAQAVESGLPLIFGLFPEQQLAAGAGGQPGILMQFGFQLA